MIDIISRQAVIKTIERANGALYWNKTLMENLVLAMKAIPTIDPVKRGKWKCFIEIGSGLYDSIDIPRAECSECGFKVPEEWGGWFKFCPNCGARME